MIAATSVSGGDARHDKFNSAWRIVSKPCLRGLAGVSNEDKLFLETISFIGGKRPPSLIAVK